jgi:hypothetical protein
LTLNDYFDPDEEYPADVDVPEGDDDDDDEN